VDLNTLIANTATLLDRVLGGLVRIELSLTPDLPPVLGEPVQLEQILLNLAVNARDAMPQGGRLLLRTEPGETGQVRLTVRDTGTGIPPEVLPRIFEPYFTTKGLGKGTGLGLAMVASLVEGHGGRIEVSSRLGEGTEFRIHLNLHASKPTPAASEALIKPQAPSYAGKRILVAEDDPNLRDLLADAFTQARAQVETAPDGLIAWRLFQQSRYDLVVSDQRMPECTGLELLARIRTVAPTLPVILVSGYGLEGMEAELGKDAHLRFFSKPFAIRQLFASGWELLQAEAKTAGTHA
jgi:CheY-like chemotaxis protein